MDISHQAKDNELPLKAPTFGLGQGHTTSGVVVGRPQYITDQQNPR